MLRALLASLFSPTVEARIMITHTVRPDNVYRLQNTIQMWGLPGRLRVLSPHMIQLELEGPQSSIQARLDQLSHNPLLAADHSINVTFHAYGGRYTSFRIV